MLTPGDRFPPFDLQDQTGAHVTRDSLLGQKTVIFFYPKDNTSGCTTEACAFRDMLSSFGGARILGVSPDDVKSHRRFVQNHGLNFTLLADTEQRLCQSVGVWVEKSMYGKKYMGVERTTFLLDENAVVVQVWSKVKPAGHAAEVHAALKALARAGTL